MRWTFSLIRTPASPVLNIHDCYSLIYPDVSLLHLLSVFCNNITLLHPMFVLVVWYV